METKYSRKEHDAYFTEPWVTEALLGRVGLRGDVLEPACGDGRMAEVLKKYGYTVACSDIKDYGYEDAVIRDFINEGPRWQYETIITNPPYNLADDFIKKALEEVKETTGMACMLLRNEFDCAKKRKWMFADHSAFHKKLILTKRPRWIEDTKTSPRHNYAWYVWDWKHEGSPAIEWIGG